MFLIAFVMGKRARPVDDRQGSQLVEGRAEVDLPAGVPKGDEEKMLLGGYFREEDFLAGIDVHLASVPGLGHDKGKFHAFPSDFLL